MLRGLPSSVARSVRTSAMSPTVSSAVRLTSFTTAHTARTSLYAGLPAGIVTRANVVRHFSATAGLRHHDEKHGGDVFAALDTFPRRHNGPSQEEVVQMLKTIGVASVEELVDKMVPNNIRLRRELNMVTFPFSFPFSFPYCFDSIQV